MLTIAFLPKLPPASDECMCGPMPLRQSSNLCACAHVHALAQAHSSLCVRVPKLTPASVRVCPCPRPCPSSLQPLCACAQAHASLCESVPMSTPLPKLTPALPKLTPFSECLFFSIFSVKLQRFYELFVILNYKENKIVQFYV